MKLNVLPGDSLLETFKQTEIEGEIIVCRECLIEGDLQADSLEDFWNVRENYLSKTYPKDENFYQENVKAEFERLLENADGSEINLWFEYEAFCQVNLWFCLWLLSEKDAEIFIIYPFLEDENDIWKGFGKFGKEELKRSFENRIKLNAEDVSFGAKLFKAFQNSNFEELKLLAEKDSDAFLTSKEVCQALADIETRPKNALHKIINEGENDFSYVFQKFNQTEKIYGFGDSQVKKICDELLA